MLLLWKVDILIVQRLALNECLSKDHQFICTKGSYSEFIMSDMKCSFILDIDWTTLQGIEFVEYMTCLLLLF